MQLGTQRFRSFWRYHWELSLSGITTSAEAKRLLITADCGGSNGSRLPLWKWELRWNKIEHRLFSFITQNWRGKPLVSYRDTVNLIAAATIRTGLRVRSELNTNTYPSGIKISDRQMKELWIWRDDLYGEWNYALLPRSAAST